MKTPIRVLLAEDNPADAELVLRALRQGGFEPEWVRVDTEEDFRARLHPGLDIILSDFAMPVFSGLRALEVLHETGLDIPFILISGTIGEETAVAAMQHGATDYLLKDRLARLGLATTQALKEGAVRRERRLAEAALRESEERFRESARTQIAILNALPAHIALLDPQGIIVAVNDAWRHFAAANVLQGPDSAIGQDYLKVCELAYGDCAEEARAAAAGIRQVLAGEVRDFTLEYPCHSPAEQRWFRLMVTPLGEDHHAGVVVMHVNVTERRLAEEALRRSQADLQLSLEASRLGTWDWNIQTGAVNWSERCLAIYGLPPGTAMSQERFLAVLHPDDRARVEAALQRAVEMRAVYDEEKRVIWPDGSVHWTASRAQVYTDAAGQPVRMAGVTFDITERKKSEEALRLFRNLVDQSSDTFEVIDPTTGQFVDVNANGPAELGCTREEYLALRVTDIDPTVTLETWRQLAETIRAVGSASGEGFHRRKDGSLFPVEFRSRWVRLDRDYIVTVVRDITERKRTEARFRRLIDSNAQGVHFRRTNGEITGANEAFLHLVGYTAEDLAAGRLNWIAMTPPEYADLDQRCHEELTARGACAAYEKEYLRKDGSRVPVLVGVAAFADDPDEGVAFVLDLTERKKLEQQFLRAQRMESIGTLAGGIAHDLNNMLGPIIMSLDLLKMKFPDPASQELLGIIGTSAQRGADMVRQVLSFARGVEGRRMEVQVRHLIQEMEKIANDTFLKNIRVRTIIPPDLWPVLGDPTQLHQVLLNLCVNARDAMPEGGTLTISAENLRLDASYSGMNHEAHPGSYVFLQVEDTGTGMPPEVLEKIFDPFFTTKAVGQGTGLGLSTSLGIVKSHGGFFRVYSEPGLGTKFKVYLPAQTQPSTATAADQAADMPRGRGELVLVVDDEAAVRQITEQTLEAFGYRVRLAADGAEAVALVAQLGEEIAVVLTDMTMPIMDGPATIQVLRRMRPGLPIIATSGLSSTAHTARAASLGVGHFLPKPFTAEALLKILRTVLVPAPAP